MAEQPFLSAATVSETAKNPALIPALTDALTAAAQRAAEQLQQRVTADGGRVLIALSGGVDSAVSALLVQRAGLDAEAVFIRNWDEDDGSDECTIEQDLASAQAVCAQLQMPLRQASFAPEYWQQVFEPMVDGYSRGDTPNPDVLCNRHIKFGVLWDYALAGGFNWLVTGHYCRIGGEPDHLLPDPSLPEPSPPNHPLLLKGVDSDKDQSYFLHGVGQQALRRTLFPIGGLQRAQVRQIARHAGLENWDRPGSTGICFIGERRFARFLADHLQAQPGDIVSLEGAVIGQHAGAALYTVGQRKGLGIGGIAGASQAPWYVASVDVPRNRIVAVQEGHPALCSQRLQLADMHWIGPPPELPARLNARIRYRQTDQACELSLLPDGGCAARFDQLQWAPAVGQYGVFYLEDRCLGGGRIVSVDRSDTASAVSAI